MSGPVNRVTHSTPSVAPESASIKSLVLASTDAQIRAAGFSARDRSLLADARHRLANDRTPTVTGEHLATLLKYISILEHQFELTSIDLETLRALMPQHTFPAETLVDAARHLLEDYPVDPQNVYIRCLRQAVERYDIDISGKVTACAQ